MNFKRSFLKTLQLSYFRRAGSNLFCSVIFDRVFEEICLVLKKKNAVRISERAMCVFLFEIKFNK